MRSTIISQALSATAARRSGSILLLTRHTITRNGGNITCSNQKTTISTKARSWPLSPPSRTLERNGVASKASVLAARSFARALSTKQTDKASTSPATGSYRNETKADRIVEDEDDTDEGAMFKKSDRASAAAQINLSAKLSKEGTASGKRAGLGEVVRLLRIARPELKPLSVAVAFLLVSSSIGMSLPFSIGKIMDIATKGPGENAQLFGLSLETFYLGLGGILALGACANFGRIIILRIVGERVVTRLRSQLFRRTMVQNAEFFDANRVGDLISRLGSDTIIVGKSITQNVSDGLRSLVSATAGFTLMGYMSLKLTGILALLFPPIAIGAFFYGRAIRTLSRRIQRALGSLTKIAEERLGNVRTSQAFVGEIQEVGRYNKQVRKIFELGKKEAYLSAIFFSTSGFMGNITFLSLLWFGGGMVRSGEISVGDLTSFLMYTAYAGSSLFGLSGFYSELMKGVGAASRLFELQDREPTISPTKGNPVRSARGDIVFDRVTFSYPTRPAVTIFKDLDFSIKQGTNVAIVAPSGAGKSTVASLIMRFYTPTAGTITIGGTDITTMNAKQLRRKIGFVGQEPVLFSGSVAENIAYGRPHASRSEIVAAARKANCLFISDFPEGLETQVGSRGTQLSGGQKQRIAIARALLKNPDILILDEATSALDAESETLVNQALGTLLASNNTTISIAHRLSTIKRSDMIVCLASDGRVAETGKITSEDIHYGFDSSSVTKSAPASKASTGPELLNPLRPAATSFDNNQSSGSDADVEDEAGAKKSLLDDIDDDDMTTSGLAKRFGSIPVGDMKASLQFISSNPAVLNEKETDGLLLEAFNAQSEGKEAYARQCVHQGLLIQYCRQLGKDGVGLFFKRVTTPGHQAQKLFMDDVNTTYARIRTRTKELEEQRRQDEAEGNGVEQIQLHAVDPNTSIHIVVPSADATTEEEKQARQIFESFPPGLQRALETGELERINEVLGKMSVEEAEEVVEQLGNGGMLSVESGVIDATTDEGRKQMEEIERSGKMPERDAERVVEEVGDPGMD